MQFIISVIDDATASATSEEMEAIDRFNEKLVANGHWIFAGGLAAPESATLVDNRSGLKSITPGPLFAATENFSGCWIINAESEQVALELAVEGSLCCNRKVELRPFLG